MRNKGITLVALVVTIVIMLILAGVTLNIALGDNGLFTRTKQAVERYKEVEAEEENILKNLEKYLENLNVDYNDFIGAYVTGYDLEERQCIIETTTSGYTTKQTFTTETDMKWRIWDYNENTGIIRLISEKPTEQQLTLNGATGYNNGVWALNEICRKCYESGERGISASNLKRSDIQRVIQYDYTQYLQKSEDLDSEENESYIYGSVKSYSEIQCPIMYDNYDKNWKYENKDGTKICEDEKEGLILEQENNYKQENGIKKSSDNLQLKQSYWYKDFGTSINKADWKNTEYYDLLFKDNEKNYFNISYWISCRCVLLGRENSNFGIQDVCSTSDYCNVGLRSLFNATRRGV